MGDTAIKEGAVFTKQQLQQFIADARRPWGRYSLLAGQSQGIESIEHRGNLERCSKRKVWGGTNGYHCV
jgi:hypothetical protein